MGGRRRQGVYLTFDVKQDCHSDTQPARLIKAQRVLDLICQCTSNNQVHLLDPFITIYTKEDKIVQVVVL